MTRVWKKDYETLRKSKQFSGATKETLEGEAEIRKMESEIGVLQNDGSVIDPHAPKPPVHRCYGPTHFVDDPATGRVRSF